jgi:hypothetical protein
MEPTAPAPPAAPTSQAPWWKTAAGWKGAVPWWFRHAKRAATLNYERGVATDDERRRLAQPAGPDARIVAARRMQDFLAWRKSMLGVAVPLLFAYAILHTIEYVRDLGNEGLEQSFGDNLPLVQAMETLRTAALWILGFTALGALNRWPNLPRSHRRLRIGWAIGFAVPVLLFFIPLGALAKGLDTMELGEGTPPGSRELMKDAVSAILGLASFAAAIPVAVAVFFGLLRAGFAAMKLAPESVVGGLAVSVGALLLALFILPIMVLLIQIGGGNSLIILGSLAILAGLLWYVLGVRTLAKPRGGGDFAGEVRPVRRPAVVLVNVGLLLLVVFGFTFSMFGKHILGFGESALVGAFDLLKIGIEFSGRSIVTAVLFCDVLSSVTAQAWSASKSVHAGPLRTLIEERVLELESVGVSDLRKSRKPDPASTPVS